MTAKTCSCKYLPPVDYKQKPKSPTHFETKLCFQTTGNSKVRILQ
jgi:hypothetical protein